MTEQELQEIRERLNANPWKGIGQTEHDIERLLNEVERLRDDYELLSESYHAFEKIWFQYKLENERFRKALEEIEKSCVVQEVPDFMINIARKALGGMK